MNCNAICEVCQTGNPSAPFLPASLETAALRRPVITLITMWLPAVVAAGAVAMETAVTNWVKGRESALLFAVFVLLAAMMHHRIRQMLITTLCYGVACLALRDMLQSHGAVLPSAYDYVWLVNARFMALLVVALLAATAGLTETLRPGTTLARRLYFGASSLYFSGLGVLNFAWHGSWQSVLLCVTGVVAFFGCLYADRIVAAEEEEPDETQPDDDLLQREREAAHLRVLKSKEWQDSAGEPLETPRPSSVPAP